MPPEDTNSGMKRINVLEQTTARLDERTNLMKEWMQKVENSVALLHKNLDQKMTAVSEEIGKVKVQNAATNAIIGIIVVLVIKFWT